MLHYVSNESKRFKAFVVNCVLLIRDNTSTVQWHYVRSKDNLAESESRRVNLHKKEHVKHWFVGSDFSYQPVETWKLNQEVSFLEIDDPEVKCCGDSR